MVVQPNSLYYGDCLDVMGKWPDACVDLCYLDPPFNSKANYNILFGSGGGGKDNLAQVMAFEDTWRWDDKAAERVGSIQRATAHPAHDAITGLHIALGNCGMIAYLSYMAERLVEIRRVLKDTGSVYLHCDPTASHYLKIVMDAVFGKRNFLNEIVWCYTGPSNTKRYFPRKHDVILYYSTKAATWTFNENAVRIPYTRLNTQITGGGIGGKLDAEARAKYLKKGKVPEDWWSSFSPVGRIASERLGYPTQKPLALLERIIKASSHEDALILDPFCGCGTTVDAANRLGRRWVGIDISPFAIDLVKNRRLRDSRVPVHGVPIDVDTARTMARSAPFEFEKWAVSRVPGIAPNSKQVGDGGVDGRGRVYESTNGHALVLAQVKGGQFGLSQLRDFLHTVNREKAALGIYITLDKVTSRNAKAEASTAGTFKMGAKTYPKVQLWSIAEHFDDREPRLPALADPYTGKAMQRDILTGQ